MSRFEHHFWSVVCSALTQSQFPAILVVLESQVVSLPIPSTDVPDPRTPVAVSHTVCDGVTRLNFRAHDEISP